MPVYIDDRDAFRRLVIVESGLSVDQGREYLRHQKNFGMCGFAAFRSEWRRAHKPELRRSKKYREVANEHDSVSVDKNGAIYGLGGWTRYTVRGDGEIMMIEGFQTSEQQIRLARIMGFRIFRDDLYITTGMYDVKRFQNCFTFATFFILEYAHEWLISNQPNKLWARRYGHRPLWRVIYWIENGLHEITDGVRSTHRRK